MPRQRAAPANSHLLPISRQEIDGSRREWVRAILDSDGDHPALLKLQVLKKAKLIDEPAPYLEIRSDRGTVVLRHNLPRRFEKTLDIDPGGQTDPYQIPAAVNALREYSEERAFRIAMKEAPEDIPISRLLLRYLELLDPKNLSKEAKKERARHAKISAEDNQSKMFRRGSNAARQLIQTLKDMPLGDVTDTFGEDYERERKKSPKLRGKLDEEGKVTGTTARGTIITHLVFFNAAWNWARRKYKPKITVEYDKLRPEETEPAGPTWDEILRAILYCMGFVWTGTGFATEWVVRRGVPRLVFVRRPYKEVAKFFPVIRFLWIYYLTGTRAEAILELGYVPLDFRGWIFLEKGRIHRNGRLAPRNLAKPRETSELLKPAQRLFRKFLREDLRLAKAHNWRLPNGRKDMYVVHDGEGRPLNYQRIYTLTKQVFEAVGVPFSLHPTKSGGVTLLHDAGFSLAQICHWFGTTEKVLGDRYRTLKNRETAVAHVVDNEEELEDGKNEGRQSDDGTIMRPPPPNPRKLSLSRLVDPHKLKIPVPPSEPSTPRAADVRERHASAH